MEAKELFSHRLKELRTEKSMSLNELAEALQTTSQSLSLYERGERTASIELLAKAAKYFNVSTDYLMGISNNRNDKEKNKEDITIGEVAELAERLTGLNQDTISVLFNLNTASKEYIEVLNEFFKHRELVFEFFTSLFDLATYSYISLKCTEDTDTLFNHRSKAHEERYRLHFTLEKLLDVYDYAKHYSVSLAPYTEPFLNDVREELKSNGNNNPKEE